MLKKVFGAIFLMVFSGMLSISCYAAEKKINAEIKKEYKTAKFIITFDEPDEYEVTITEPHDKEEYKASQTGKNEATCIIQDVTPGKWVITVKRIRNEDGDQTFDDDGNPIPVEDPEIGGVHVEIQGSASELAEVSKDIKVAADISGLNMYFKDETFIAEWSEAVTGGMTIELTDSKTQEKLISQTVDGTYFEYELDPEMHKNIIIKMVPSESSSVENAERRWTYSTYNHPDAAFVFPAEDITNKDSIQAHMTLGKSYYIDAFLNGKEIYKSDETAAGEYDLDLKTEVGNNEYLIYVIDPETNYMRSYTYSIEKDVVAPAIRLARSYENITTEDEAIVFEGSIDPDYEVFTINDADIKVEGDHSFKYEYALKEGVNNIKIIASDRAGNVSEYNTTVTRVIPEPAKVPWFPIILGGCLVGLLATYIIAMVLRNRRGGIEESCSNKKSGNFLLKILLPKNGVDVIDPRIAFAIRIIIPVLIVVIMQNYIVCITTVASGSMEPKLKVGNTAAYNRLAYKKHTPERGDIVMFWSDEMNEHMAKRIIGVPGDEIKFIDGYVFINGQRADETEYISDYIETNCSESFTVPDGSVFVMGDNREYSYDSRFFYQPYIPMSKLEGKYMGQSAFNPIYMIKQRLLKKAEEKAAEKSASSN